MKKIKGGMIMKVKKVLLAIGKEDAEKAIQKRLSKEFRIVGVAIYKEQILNLLKQQPKVDILLLRENIAGSMDVLSLLFTIRNQYPNTRIILMTGQREIGDAFLATVVSYGVHDILIGYSAKIDDVISHFERPRTFADVAKYQSIAPSTQVQYTKQMAERNRTAPKQPPRVEQPVSVDLSGGSVLPSGEQPARKMPQTINNPFEKKGGASGKRVNRGAVPNQETVKRVEVKEEVSPQVSSTTDIDDLFSSGGESFSLDGVSTEESFAREETIEQNVQQAPSRPTTVERPQVQQAPSRPTTVERPQIQQAPSQPVTVERPQIQPMPIDEERTQPQGRKPGQAKILPSDDMKRVEKEFVTTRRAVKDINVKPMVLSVLGAKTGVGVTTVAFNLALSLAQEKFKVLYIELNDKGIPFSFNYHLENNSNGLERALEKIAKGDINDAFNHVMKMEQLKKEYKGTEYSSLYNKYPNSLDYIAFSNSFILDTDRTYSKEGLSQLLMSALLTEGYQYIIIDINVHSDEELINQALKNSKGIFSVVTQNMTSVAQNIHYLEQVHQKVINLNKKLYFVINEYENEGISSKSLSKWINQEMDFKHEDVLVVPNFSKQIIKANGQYLPITLASSAKDIQKAYKTLANYTRMF